MKHLVTTALALTLIAGAASAQDRDDRGGRGGRGGDRGDGVAHSRNGQAVIQQAPPQQAQPQIQGGRGGQNFDRGGDRGRGEFNRGGRPDFSRGDNRGNFDRDRGDRGRPDFDRGGPGFRPRAGGFLAERHWNFSQRFRGPAYRYPRGFGYQYWAFGSFLPSVFLGQDYTLYDYWTYGLPAPPAGFHWIRVGPDALLVRYGDGYVLDAAYGLFY